MRGVTRGDAPHVVRRLPLAIIFRAFGAVSSGLRCSKFPMAIIFHAFGAVSSGLRCSKFPMAIIFRAFGALFRVRRTICVICGSKSHSFRSVNVGSIRVALSEGIRHAAAPTRVSRHATAPNVTGSALGVANSSDAIALLSISAAASPAASPSNINVNACRIIMVKIRPLVAPSAMRIPISRVRCVTANAMTPVSPAAVMKSASSANTPSSHVVWRGDATESSSAC